MIKSRPSNHTKPYYIYTRRLVSHICKYKIREPKSCVPRISGFLEVGDVELLTNTSSVPKYLSFQRFQIDTTYGCIQTYFRVQIHSFCSVCNHLLKSLERQIFRNGGSSQYYLLRQTITPSVQAEKHTENMYPVYDRVLRLALIFQLALVVSYDTSMRLGCALQRWSSSRVIHT